MKHVIAYLDSVDLKNFNPHAAPPKTDAFWAMVAADQGQEECDLADAIDALGKPDAQDNTKIIRPDAFTLKQLREKAPGLSAMNDDPSWLRPSTSASISCPVMWYDDTIRLGCSSRRRRTKGGTAMKGKRPEPGLLGTLRTARRRTGLSGPKSPATVPCSTGGGLARQRRTKQVAIGQRAAKGGLRFHGGGASARYARNDGVMSRGMRSRPIRVASRASVGHSSE
jgi:hypothetical protein